MKNIQTIVFLLILSSIFIQAQDNKNIQFTYLGKVEPRHAKEIHSSMLSVGGETMDRDYTIYDNWKEYLGPLGAKKIRLQSGWAKTEFEKGKYNFAWLDSIILDVVDQGVEPWINISYGNPLYGSGGGTGLGAAMPKTPESIAAFVRYVEQLVVRYKDNVDEWEIWNEGVPKNDMMDYINLYIPTAEAIRAIQPNAKIIALSMSRVRPEQADDFLNALQAEDKLHLVDYITYHAYSQNPLWRYQKVYEMQEVIAKYSDKIKAFQGENGAPSERRETKALSNYDWTELSQAKWTGRRMMGDLGRGIPTSIFSIIDLNYPDEINRKGLLHAEEDQKVHHIKPAYYMFQHVAAIFDYTLVPVENFSYQVNSQASISLFAFQHRFNNMQAVAIWFDSEIPSDNNKTTSLTFNFTCAQFNNPVFVDLRTGDVFEIPKKNQSQNGNTWTFKNIPVYDSPVLIIDKSIFEIK